MKRIPVILAISLFGSCFLAAQKNAWTFSQCVDTALNRNITVNQTRLSNELTKVTLSQVKSNRIPSLNAGINESVNFGKNIDPTTNQFVVQTYNSTNFSVGSSLNLFNGLQNSRTIKQNMMNVTAGEYDVENAKNTVILSITTAYLQVLFSYELLAVAQMQADATEIQVDRTKKMVDAGKVPDLNLLQIRSQQATDKLSVINARNQLDLAKVTLMQLMEIPVDDSFEIVRPELTDPATLLLESREVIFQKALQVQPQIAGAGIRSTSAEMGIKISEGARWPRINLTGSTSTNFAASSRTSTTSGVNPNKEPFFTQMWDNLGAGLGLNLSIPIYSNRQIKSNIDRAKINLLNTRLSEQNTRNQLRKSIEQAYADLRSSMNKFEAVKLQYDAAKASYETMELKYSVGVINTIDYLVEKNNFAQAQSNLIQSKYDFIFKSKILDFYQGKAIEL